MSMTPEQIMVQRDARERVLAYIAGMAHGDPRLNPPLRSLEIAQRIPLDPGLVDAAIRFLSEKGQIGVQHAFDRDCLVFGVSAAAIERVEDSILEPSRVEYQQQIHQLEGRAGAVIDAELRSALLELARFARDYLASPVPKRSMMQSLLSMGTRLAENITAKIAAEMIAKSITGAS